MYILSPIANTVLRNTTGYRGREIHHSVPVIEFLQKKRLHFCKRFCDPGGTRTLDPMIKSHLLYQLSYQVILFRYRYFFKPPFVSRLRVQR